MSEVFERLKTRTKAELWDAYAISTVRQLFTSDTCSGEYPLNPATTKLLAVNAVLWDLEDDHRKAHAEGNTEQILLYSRMIIEMNRRRAAIKSEIARMEGDPDEGKKYALGM